MSISPFDDLIRQVMNEQDDQSEKRQMKKEMWQLTVYKGDELILEHKQNDFTKVLKFGMNSLVELINGGAKDYRIVLCNKDGHVYFQAIGEHTVLVDLKRKTS